MFYSIKRTTLAVITAVLMHGCSSTPTQIDPEIARAEYISKGQIAFAKWQPVLDDHLAAIQALPSGEFCWIDVKLTDDNIIAEVGPRARDDGLRRGDRLLKVNGMRLSGVGLMAAAASADGYQSDVVFSRGDDENELTVSCSNGAIRKQSWLTLLTSARTQQWDACTFQSRKLERQRGYGDRYTRNLEYSCDGFKGWFAGEFSSFDSELEFQLMKANYRELEVDKFNSMDLELAQTNFRNRAWKVGRKDLMTMADSGYQEALNTRSEIGRVRSLPGKGQIAPVLDRSPTGENGGAGDGLEMPDVSVARSQGTCFAVDRGGLVVTNHHVIEDANVFYAKFEGMVEPVRLSVLVTSQANDLAVLRADRELPAALTLSRSVPMLGDRVYTLGYPVANMFGGQMKYTDGVISGTSGFYGESVYLQTTTAIQPGNSGGPMIDVDGDVIGVMTASARIGRFMELTGGSIPQNINFAVKADYLASLIRDLRLTKIDAQSAQSISDAKRSICTLFAS